jgi:hypothetical protein
MWFINRLLLMESYLTLFTFLFLLLVYLMRICHNKIKDHLLTLQEGGLNGFMHSFLAEVMAICRAHVAALGGNALVAYQLTECIIEDNVHKNQVI